MVLLFLLLLCLIKIPVFNANSVNPEQMQCSAVSDLGLYCRSVTFLSVSRLKLVSHTLSA